MICGLRLVSNVPAWEFELTWYAMLICSGCEAFSTLAKGYELMSTLVLSPIPFRSSQSTVRGSCRAHPMARETPSTSAEADKEFAID